MLRSVFILGLTIIAQAPATNARVQERSTATENSDANPTPLGILVPTAGHRMHLYCTGTGSPTVVLSPGGGDFSFDWGLVQPNASKVTRVCSYDYSGAAWSELGPTPRTLHQSAYNLFNALKAAEVPGPYVLVGQSIGGIASRVFLEMYPTDVSGMVLVDSTWEDARLGCPDGTQCKIRLLSNRPIPPVRDTATAADGLSSERRKFLEDNFIASIRNRTRVGSPFNRLPPALQQARLWATKRPESWEATNNEYMADEFADLYEKTQRNPEPLGNLPLIVLTRGISGYPPDIEPMMEPERVDGQKGLAKLSRNSRQIIATHSDHRIQFDDPDLVTCAIREVVEASRRKITLPESTTCTPQ